jgi:predicted RNA-binding Zn-ribbon protein involved in translation (DUF1610 family)
VPGIRAHCRACHYSIYLTELVRSPFLDAHCPNCGRDLVEREPQCMRREAARAVRAHQDLVESVRYLVRLPGNLQLVPHTLVRDLFDEIDWRRDVLIADRELIRREIEALERYLETWSELVDSDSEDADRRNQLLQRLRRLSTVLRRFAGVDPAPESQAQPEPQPVSRPGD